MQNNYKVFIAISFISIYFLSCSKPSTTSTTAVTCADKTIVVSAIATATSGGTSTNGSLSASATGSTGFTYSLNNGSFQSSGTFSNLVAGSYSITAKDDAGCTSSKSFTVTAAACPTITITQTVTQTTGSTSTNGSITASATGGASPYTFSKNGTTFQVAGLFSNLAVGTYTIVAKDANGCLGTSANINVTSAACPSIILSNAVTGSDKCANNTGSINITATGSTGFQFSIDNGVTFQTNSLFSNLATGGYSVVARDANGCTTTNTAQVPVATAGVKFTAVKNVMAAYCISCHGGATPQSGINFTDDCTIVSQKARIKARAVDFNPSVMPQSGPIPATERQKITDWINAGGLHSTN